MKNLFVRNKVVVIFCVIVVLVFTILGSVLFCDYYLHNVKGTELAIVVKEMDKNTPEFFEELEYEVGLNAIDMPVFKDREKALELLKSECQNGIKEVKDKYGLKKFSKYTWRDYFAFINGAEGSFKYMDEVNKIGNVLDIYENSFEDQGTNS